MSNGTHQKVTILGNLGKDPEVRYTPDGRGIANLTVATTEKWKDKNTGQERIETEWHRVVIFGKLAEIAGQYLAKGSKVLLEGKIKTRKWQDQSGADRYTTEIIVDFNGTMEMVGGRNTEANDEFSGAPKPQQQQKTQQAPAHPPIDDGWDDFDDDEQF